MKKKNLEELLSHTFDTYHLKENGLVDCKKRADFIFHMTDWISDLETLAKLYEDPTALNRKTAKQFIFGFLVHVIPHLNAAGRLLLDEVSDPFSPIKARVKNIAPR